MMNKLIAIGLYLLSQALLASEATEYLSRLQNEAKNGSASSQAILERIRYFELDMHNDRSPSIVADPSQVMFELEQDLMENYRPYLESQLGTCQDENCLSISEEGSVLKVASKSVCFPYTNCGFYKCMEDKYRCSEVGVHYFSKLAYPTCSAYRANIKKNKFTQKGVEWIYNVMVCLQKGLVEECDVQGNCAQETRKKVCDHITDYTLSFHPSCYINSGVGVCKLPLKDQLNIWKTVGPFLTDRERVEAYKVVAYCLKNY